METRHWFRCTAAEPIHGGRHRPCDVTAVRQVRGGALCASTPREQLFAADDDDTKRLVICRRRDVVVAACERRDKPEICPTDSAPD